MRVDLPPDPTSARLARHAVVEACEGSQVDLDAAAMCVSELVTNALLHAVPPLWLEVVVTGRGVRVAVHDGAQEHAARMRPQISNEVTTGRGLSIVDALADRWDIEVTPTGKLVWFELQAA